jgi:outer membrane protein OmpA-like peptidoglycan-associated protein
MSFDILESLSTMLGTPAIRQLGSSLGENEDNTRAAVRSAGPTLLAGLMQRAATPSGATEVFKAVTDERVDSGIAGKLGDMLGNRGNLDSMRTSGEGFLKNLFGTRSEAVTSAISETSGVRPTSAMSLLSMGVPLLLGILRKQTMSKKLDASGLASLLFSQRDSLARSGLDNRITNALGFGSLSNFLNMLPGATTQTQRPHMTATPEPTHRRAGWVPWAVAAAIAALALMIFNRPGERAQRTAAVPTETATRVYFETGQTAVDNEDRVKIATIAKTVKIQDRPVAITGYTDPSGDRERNREAAQERAAAVREALVAEGIPESRIQIAEPTEAADSRNAAEAQRVDIILR